MLAEAVSLFSSRISVLMSTSLRHEFQTHLLCLFEAQRKSFNLVVDVFSNLIWEFTQSSLFVDLLRPPVPLLRRNISRGRNPDVGIDEEEGQDLAMAWLGLVVKFEGLNTVLKNIREDQKAVFAGQNLPDHLHSRHLESDQ